MNDTNIKDIGRNDPCPCGSGLKYKKCCLLKLDEQTKIQNSEWDKWFEQDQAIGAKNLADYNKALEDYQKKVTKKD